MYKIVKHPVTYFTCKKIAHVYQIKIFYFQYLILRVNAYNKQYS